MATWLVCFCFKKIAAHALDFSRNVQAKLDSGKTFEVVKCFDVKNNAGDIKHKKTAIKCSLKSSPSLVKLNYGSFYSQLHRM